MIVKIHKTNEGRKVVAICDSDLIGKKFYEENLQLDLNCGFYKGEEKSEDETRSLIKGGCIVNLVGEKSVNFGLKMKIIDKDKIVRIKKIPHAEAIV